MYRPKSQKDLIHRFNIFNWWEFSKQTSSQVLVRAPTKVTKQMDQRGSQQPDGTADTVMTLDLGVLHTLQPVN